MTRKPALKKLVDSLDQGAVLVVGDLILDRFIWGKVDRISPEAPVPVLRVTHESTHLGGAANVAANIAALGGQVVPVGLVGEDEAAQSLRTAMLKLGIEPSGLVVEAGLQTTQKTRIVAHHQQVVRVDREGPGILSQASRSAVKEQIAARLGRVAAVVVSDYGKGVIDRDLLVWLREHCGQTFLCVDPKDKNFDYYRGVDILTPNKAEAERMSGVAIEDEASLRMAAGAIFQRLNCKHLLITQGEQGMALFESPDRMTHIPTLAREVFDVSGAGDTVIATFALARAAGSSLHQAALLANAAAGVVVGKLGTATLTPKELRGALD